MIRFSKKSQQISNKEKWARLLSLELDRDDEKERLMKRIAELEKRNEALERGFKELRGIIPI